jgi:hypothetical protein
MRCRMRKAVAVSVVLVGCVLIGCISLKYMPKNWGGRGSANSGLRKTGRTNYGIACLSVNDRVYFTLVSEGGNSLGNSGPPASGTLRAADGRTVEWTCNTADRQTGHVTIGTERFELEKGGVFLVNLRGGKTVVEQVAVEVGQLQGRGIEDRLQAVSQSNERLAEFLKLCKTPK